MYDDKITIDIDRLRSDMHDDGMGAFFGGGFGGALLEFFEVGDVSPEELVQMAQGKRIYLYDYRV